MRKRAHILYVFVYCPGTGKGRNLIKKQQKHKKMIHRFVHETGPGKRSGGLGAGKFHDFSARVFLDRSQT